MTEVATGPPPIVVDHPIADDPALALLRPLGTRRGAIRRARRRAAVELAAVLGTPVLLFYVLRAEPFFRQNGIDPFLYLGYSFDQKNLIVRYGPTYYGVRFGLLLPMKFATRVFGPVGGYFVLRYALAMLAAGAIYALFRRTHGRGAAWLGFVLMLTSPMLLRALMTSYSDTTGVPYLTAGLVLLMATTLQPRPDVRTAAMLAAGTLFGLAVHSNPFNAALVVVLVGSYGLVELTRRRWRLVVDGALLVLAVLVVTGLGAAYYEWRFGTGNILKPSVDAISTYSGQAGDAFRAPSYAWVRFRFHLYIAPITLVVWAVARLGRWRRVTRAEACAMLALGGTFAFFALHQFVLHNVSMEIYFYTSYLTGPMVIGLTYAAAALVDRRDDREVLLGVGAASVVLLPLLRNHFWTSFEFDLWPTVPFLVAVTLAAAVLATARATAPRGGALLGATGVVVLLAMNTALLLGAPRNPPLSPGQTFRYDARYDLAYGNDDPGGLNWYELTYDLVEKVPDLETPEGHVLFWFADDSNLVSAIQSTYLWRQSALMSTGPGMPFLDEWRLSRLVEQRARWLIVLGVTRAEIDTGIAALRERGVVILGVENWELRAGNDVIQGSTVTLNPPPG